MDSTRPIDQANGAPLSYEQEQLRFLNQSTPGAGLGHLHSTVAMRGEVDAVALRESLAAFVGRHEIWRTIFPIRDGQPRPLVEAEGRWTWSVADLSGLGRAEAEEEAGRRAHEQAGQHFDLERGPLLRALLVRVEDQEHRLFLSLHRIIADTASLTDVFLPELRELYEAQMQDRPARLYERPPQYADYARWQRSQIEAHGTLEAQAEVLGDLSGGGADRAGASGRPPPTGAADLRGREAGIRPDGRAQRRAAEVEPG